MARNFGALVFTPVIKALQERYGNRRGLRGEGTVSLPDQLGEPEKQFIAERDSFYMASVGETGWPYVQHRGGPPGFLKTFADNVVAFTDFRGNRQYITTGNLTKENRVALILVDYPAKTRLKILGRAEVLEGAAAAEWTERLRDAEYQAVIERVFMIQVEAFDWNCQQHITPRFTAPEIEEALVQTAERMQALEDENKRLRGELTKAAAGSGPAADD